MAGEETFYAVGGAVVNDVEIIVARVPRVFQKLTAFVLEGDGQRVAQFVQRVTQWRAPLLIPIGMTPRVAAAVFPPTIDAVKTAPRAFLDDLHLMRRWMPFKIFAVVGEPGVLL